MSNNEFVTNGKGTITHYNWDGVTTDLVIPNKIGSEKIKNIVPDILFYGKAGLSLTSITIPANLTNISTNMFANCWSLTEINVDPKNRKYCSVDGVLFNKNQTTLLVYPMYKQDECYSVPDTVKHISAFAFANCHKLRGITIPDSVTTIGDYTFSECIQLLKITLPKNLYKIGDYVFAGCNRLYSINIPDGIVSIGHNAFDGCELLTHITIPNSVKSMGRYAFRGCTSLTSITIPNGIDRIWLGAFMLCANLTSITIPNSVTAINGYAFCNCNNLYTIDYRGTRKQWNSITIGMSNEVLSRATIYTQE